MPHLVWRNLIGQDRAKDVLGKAFAAGTLGHAYLFAGAEGTGKLQAALELSLALLCESGEDAPCYTCGSCRRVLGQSHPDFHLLFPLALGAENKSSDGTISEDGWTVVRAEALRRIEHPYAATTFEGVPVIPVDWIREANRAILRGTVEGKRCVAIIDGIDLMNKESANAMLKTLEEPPPNTMILLLTERPQSVLPTISSRCQVFRFGYLTAAHIADGLVRHGPANFSDQDREQAALFADGSLGRALELIERPLAEASASAMEFWRLCLSGDRLGLAGAIDALTTGQNYERCTHVFTHIGHACAAGTLEGVALPAKYIPTQGGQPSMMDAAGDVTRVGKVLEACQHAVSALRSHGNAPLVLVNFASCVMEIVHE